MLSSQVGFAVSTHFCGGEVSDRAFSLIASKVGCGMEEVENSCSSDQNSADSITKKSCCENKSEVFQLRENFNKKQSTVEFKLEFLIAFLVVSQLLSENQNEELVYANLPSPPIIQGNTQVLFQSFLL